MNNKAEYFKTVSLTAKNGERRENGNWRERLRMRGGKNKMRLLCYVFQLHQLCLSYIFNKQ